MIIVDTSVWIEFFKSNEPYRSKLEELLEAGQILAIESVFAELMQGARSEREVTILNDYWRCLPKSPLENVLYKAGVESGRNKWFSKGIGLIDASIILMARETKSKVWSLDKKLNSILKKDELFHIL